MRRTTIILLFLLNILTSVWAAGSVDWSKHIVPKPYDADAVLVTKSDTSYHGRVYQIYRDQLGSALLYANRTHSYGFHYSPWGTRLIDETTQTTYRPGQALPQGCPFYRTYTGHEDLWMFGLLNMNARLYNPYLGRFLSPDPLINQEGGPLDYNPYVYARNNPYKYIDRDGELWWLVPIIMGAAINGTTYAISAAITGNWNTGNFLKSMGMGAVMGTLGIGTSLLCTQLGTFGQSFTYGLLSNMVNNTVTNAIFGENMSFKDIPGIIAGAATITVLPGYSPHGNNLFINTVTEIGSNTLRGGIMGATSGVVNALVHDDMSLFWKGAMGGAISGFSRSVLHNSIMGAPYKDSSCDADGVYRKGGVAGWVMNKLEMKGAGITLGRQIFTIEDENDQISILNTRYHENYHLLQIKALGLAHFYGRTISEYIKYGLPKVYIIPGTLEFGARQHEPFK